MNILSRNIYLKRFFLALFFIVILIIGLEIFAPSASADSVSEIKKSAPSVAPFKLERSDQTTTTTTTTTTTVPPTKKTVNTTPKAPAPVQAYTPTGDWVAQCHAWAAQVGVTLPPSAITLIGRESSCNPSVMNHGGSGAGGIAQALPYTKMGCSMDAAGAPCQILWMQNYVNARYGGWDGALSHSYSRGWY